MCHDLATAGKYYVSLPSAEEQFKIRQSRMRALHEEAVMTDTDSTSEDELPQLQDTDTNELLSDDSEDEDEDQIIRSVSDSEKNSKEVKETSKGETDETVVTAENMTIQENNVSDRAHQQNVLKERPESHLETREISINEESDKKNKNEKQGVINESGTKIAKTAQETAEAPCSQTCSPTKSTADFTVGDAKEDVKQMKETYENRDEAESGSRNEDTEMNSVKDRDHCYTTRSGRAVKRKFSLTKYLKPKSNVLQESTEGDLESKDGTTGKQSKKTKKHGKQGDVGEEKEGEPEKSGEQMNKKNKNKRRTERNARRQRIKKISMNNDHGYMTRKRNGM